MDRKEIIEIINEMIPKDEESDSVKNDFKIGYTYALKELLNKINGESNILYNVWCLYNKPINPSVNDDWGITSTNDLIIAKNEKEAFIKSKERNKKITENPQYKLSNHTVTEQTLRWKNN